MCGFCADYFISEYFTANFYPRKLVIIFIFTDEKILVNSMEVFPVVDILVIGSKIMHFKWAPNVLNQESVFMTFRNSWFIYKFRDISPEELC